MRADRLLSIVWLLRAHGRLSAAELAKRLEVSTRTILRDVDALSAAGVPVYCERGRSGGVRLVPGYRTDVTALSSDESRALFAAVTTWGADSLGLGDALASALRKLLAAIPDAHRSATALIAERIVVDQQGWLPGPAGNRSDQLLGTLQEAVLDDRRLLLRYRSRDAGTASTRTVDPHGLIGSGGVWYLCASHRGRVRFYRLSRIEWARLLEDPAYRPPGTDVRALWRERRDSFQRQLSPLTASAWVRTSRRGDVHERTMGHREITAVAPPPPRGPWLLLSLDFVDDQHAMAFFLGLGQDARVVEPQSLRDDVVHHAREIVHAHAPDDAEDGLP